MRIISGKYKGNLVSFSADHIRPTTDRVKESLFNILQGQIEGAKVLDLFSGTGSLGIECLSRGASEVLFIEKNSKSLRILRENLQKLKVDDPFSIVQKDVISFLKSYSGPGFDLIFADPPFTEEMADEVMESLSKTLPSSRVILRDTIICIESGRREKIGEDYPHLFRYDQREFGDKFLSFFKMKEVPNPDSTEAV